MRLLDAFAGYVERYALARVFLLVYLFFQPFERFTSVREIAFGLMFLFFVVGLLSGRTKVSSRDWTVRAFIILAFVALLSALLSHYQLESFNAIRKNLLYQAVVFFVIIGEHKTFDALRHIFYAMFAGFAVLSVVILLNYDMSELFNWLSLKEAPFLGGYSLNAVFFIPLAVAYLFASKDSLTVKCALAFFILIELVLSILNNHRSQVVAILAASMLITIMAKRYRYLAAGLIVCVIAGAGIFYAKPGSFDRYRTLLNPANYVSNDSVGWNDRASIWSGVVDMIKERPIIGHGYGWKKIALVAKDNGYLDDKWDKSGRTHLYFSQAGYGAANPHNLPLQILFEVGLAGLVAFVFFWATVIVKGFNAVRLGRGTSTGGLFLRYAVPGVFLGYVLINFSNGLWEESYGVLMMSFAAVCVVLSADLRQGHGEADER
ncbi:MAG: O-antigen ligase family protein [Deltaproteobacteria bacterium]|nr:O-antigen ligase family protein [Deltaproteobacteria bacterium]